MSEVSLVEARRGETVESRHAVHAAVVDATSKLHASSGDPELVAFARSAVKPLQAIPLVEDGAAAHYGFGAEELALMCASHSGEPRHVAVVRSMLKAVGVEEDMLACGAHAPFHAASAAGLVQRGVEPGRIHNNCSGKHAGMLALAQFHGWDPGSYHTLPHPVQQRMAREISTWCGVTVDSMAAAVDGCGVPTFALPLSGLALGFARCAEARRRREEGRDAGGVAADIVGAMTGHPELVAGTGRLCTALMRATQGRVFAKVGAEGVYCAGVAEAGIGVALKVEDGAVRAAEPALLALLAELGFLTSAELEELAEFARPELRNTRGEVVGALRVDLRLARSRG